VHRARGGFGPRGAGSIASLGMSKFHRLKILLVEDFDDARELYSICLRSSGYDVIEVFLLT
jgi:hypothetical protein